MNKPPLVTIGVPVFNESRFLTQTLDSLLAQDYKNIEIIISDNHSTDETESICQAYNLEHKHISYHRFDENHGPTKNFEYVLNHANGEYFMWAAGHDLWSSNYITACVQILDSHPKAVIAYGASRWINKNSEIFEREYGWTDTRGMDIIARYFTIFWGNMHPILGVIRKRALQDCPINHTVGADLIILSYLILKGDFIHAVEASWSRREFRNEKNHNDKLKRYKNQDNNSSPTLINKLFPLARLPIGLIKVISKSKSSLLVRLSILILLIPSLPIRLISGKRKN